MAFRGLHLMSHYPPAQLKGGLFCSPLCCLYTRTRGKPSPLLLLLLFSTLLSTSAFLFNCDKMHIKFTILTTLIYSSVTLSMLTLLCNYCLFWASKSHDWWKLGPSIHVLAEPQLRVLISRPWDCSGSVPQIRGVFLAANGPWVWAQD